MSRVNGRSPVNGNLASKTSIRKSYVFYGEERVGFVMQGNSLEWSWGTLGLADDISGYTYSKKESAEACVKAWIEATK
jgi:hypothetical protein